MKFRKVDAASRTDNNRREDLLWQRASSSLAYCKAGFLLMILVVAPFYGETWGGFTRYQRKPLESMVIMDWTVSSEMKENMLNSLKMLFALIILYTFEICLVLLHISAKIGIVLMDSTRWLLLPKILLSVIRQNQAQESPTLQLCNFFTSPEII